MIGKCNYPACKAKASKTWATVSLCEGHHETIRRETEKYYAGQSYHGKKLVDANRTHYNRIRHLTLWSKDGDEECVSSE